MHCGDVYLSSRVGAGGYGYIVSSTLGDFDTVHAKSIVLRGYPMSECPVLIVEDESEHVQLLQRHLGGTYSLVVAQDGLEALQILRRTRIPIVIADWLMPVMDGLSLCRAIRSEPDLRTTYVLILTARDKEDDLVEAIDAGADDYLVKPFSARELSARVRAGWRIVNLQRELSDRNATLLRMNAQLNTQNSQLNVLATHDELTGLANTRENRASFERIWEYCWKLNQPLACVIIDLDHFKRINDTHGHPVGDRVLKEVADILKKHVRVEDFLSRIGGEEFFLLCPDTDILAAGIVAERLRQAVEQAAIRVDDIALQLTISAGIAQRSDDMLDTGDLYKAADEALYHAKQNGRNQVATAARRRAQSFVGQGLA